MTSLSTSELPVDDSTLETSNETEKLESSHNYAPKEITVLCTTENIRISNSNAENKFNLEMNVDEDTVQSKAHSLKSSNEQEDIISCSTENTDDSNTIAKNQCDVEMTVEEQIINFTSIEEWKDREEIGVLCSTENTENHNAFNENRCDIEKTEVETVDGTNSFANKNEQMVQENIAEPEHMATRLKNGLESMEDVAEQNDHSVRFQYNWTTTPKLLTAATEEYQPTPSCENFTKGCQWSPDGTCLLVPSEDFRIRVYELPQAVYSGQVSSELELPSLKPALTAKEGGLIYDSCWYPLMNSWDPSTCCFASTSRESPVHLWDAFSGELRATYRAYNQVDEVAAAVSVQFIYSGREVWCGFKGAIRTFDTSRPGRQTATITLKKDIPNVTGIVSCIRENPAMPGLVAFGTYSKAIGLYKDGPLCALNTASGVTQIEFSPCGTKLYSVVRRNNEMLCWDLRNPGMVLFSMQGRQADTNQRIQFSISPAGTDIASGGTDGIMSIWQPSDNITYEDDLEARHKIRLSHDCINGVSLHRSLPIVASCSGQRICDLDGRTRDNGVRLWWCAPVK